MPYLPHAGLTRWAEALQHASLLAAYEPRFNGSPGQGHYSASIEMREGKSMAVSFFQHMAFTR